MALEISLEMQDELNMLEFMDENPDYTLKETRELFKFLDKIDGYMFFGHMAYSSIETEYDCWLFDSKEEMFRFIREA